eukprot:COSAG01_NODE_52724_length_344_cov_2.073469_1_plen_52_part_01
MKGSLELERSAAALLLLAAGRASQRLNRWHSRAPRLRGGGKMARRRGSTLQQ